MTLTLESRGFNRDSAAMSIAANRLSKVRLLLADESERCDAIAGRFARSLAEDVRDHLRRFPQTSPSTAAALEQMADEAMTEANVSPELPE